MLKTGKLNHFYFLQEQKTFIWQTNSHHPHFEVYLALKNRLNSDDGFCMVCAVLIYFYIRGIG